MKKSVVFVECVAFLKVLDDSNDATNSMGWTYPGPFSYNFLPPHGVVYAR